MDVANGLPVTNTNSTTSTSENNTTDVSENNDSSNFLDALAQISSKQMLGLYSRAIQWTESASPSSEIDISGLYQLMMSNQLTSIITGGVNFTSHNSSSTLSTIGTASDGTKNTATISSLA